MNTRSRFIIISIIILISILFVWPNFAKKTVQVYFQEGASLEVQKESAESLAAYLGKNYPERYTWKVEQLKDEVILVLEGRFIQTAFLNELGHQNGVDPVRTKSLPTWIEQRLKAHPFKLGLDLQGGMNLVLQADFDKLREKLEEQYPQELRDQLKKTAESDPDPKKKQEAKYQLQQIERAFNFSDERKKADTEGAKEIIRSRVDSKGLSEPLIRLQGVDRIEISIPGVSSPEQSKRLIAATARVEYHLAEPPATGSDGDGVYTRMASAYFKEYLTKETEYQRKTYIKETEQKINLPLEYGIYVYYNKQVTEKGTSELAPASFMVLEREVSLSGDDVSRNVNENYDPNQLQHIVEFQLTAEGRKKFAEVTSNNKGRQLAILIDDKIRSAPRINGPITGGSAQITGGFSLEEAKDLALIMKEGALPVPMNFVEERTVGPTLGLESIKKGVKAILVGLMLVLVFIVLYYLYAGALAGIALVLNLLFMAAIFALMDFTITLPGLAGVVLTLGMAVDANVIVFERIKEELSRGKTLKAAVSQGFERATYTIMDSNITTMIAAIVLAAKGAGPIKGFGVTLLVGIITTLFTSLYVSKTLIYLFVYDFNLKSFNFGLGKYRKSGAENREAVK